MSVLVTVLSVLGGCSFIGTITVAVMQRKKVGADAASVLTGSALQIVEDLRTELKGARSELRETRAELGAVRRHMGVLEQLLRERGVPVPELTWPPSGWPVGD